MASFTSRGYAALFVALAALMPWSLHAQARFDFNLPAQSLDRSLRVVGSKAHVTIAFDPAVVTGHRAPALKGSYSARDALERLLRDSGLRIRDTAAGSFWVEAMPAAGHTAD